MSVITSLTAVPSRFEILYEMVGGNDLNREQLINMVTPSALRKEDAKSLAINETLKESMSMGWIVEESGKLKINHVKKESPDCFRSFISSYFWDKRLAEESGQRDFSLGLAWFLTLDPLDPVSWEEPVPDLKKNNLNALETDFSFTNKARVQNFIYWVEYLGFCERVSLPKAHQIIPDPTKAISAKLEVIKKKKSKFAVKDFISALCQELPVLEGGVFRDQIEQNITSKRQQDYFSRSTSIALLRMKTEGKISLLQESDANLMICAVGAKEVRISDVEIH